jgi:hypothetical protein
MIIKVRNYDSSVIISTQKLSGADRTIRLNMPTVFTFRALNGNKVDEILDEFSRKARKHNYKLLTEYIWDKPYQFLYCKFDGRNQVVFYTKPRHLTFPNYGLRTQHKQMKDTSYVHWVMIRRTYKRITNTPYLMFKNANLSSNITMNPSPYKTSSMP